MLYVKHVSKPTYILLPKVRPMKSKLTLRLDAQVKQDAKNIARQKGTSLSKLVEDYFRLLVHESSLESGDSGRSVSVEGVDGESQISSLPPRVQTLKEELGQEAPRIDLDEDTRSWIDAASEKHA